VGEYRHFFQFGFFTPNEFVYFLLGFRNGDVLAPEVSDRLVTDVVSARQRGISVLSAAALKRRQTMTVPLLTGGTNPGLILPGYLIQVQEPGETWRGLVRGITVTTGVPTVRQQLVVERAG
jgi:hypothetical protein